MRENNNCYRRKNKGTWKWRDGGRTEKKEEVVNARLKWIQERPDDAITGKQGKGRIRGKELEEEEFGSDMSTLSSK